MRNNNIKLVSLRLCLTTYPTTNQFSKIQTSAGEIHILYSFLHFRFIGCEAS